MNSEYVTQFQLTLVRCKLIFKEIYIINNSMLSMLCQFPPMVSYTDIIQGVKLER